MSSENDTFFVEKGFEHLVDKNETDHCRRLISIEPRALKAYLGFYMYQEKKDMPGVQVLKTKKTFQGLQASINMWCKKRKIDLCAETSEVLSQYSSNFRRVRRREKEKAPLGTQTEEVGKSDFPALAMVKIGKLAYTKFGTHPSVALKYGVFASALANSGGRGDSTGSIGYTQTIMSSDCMRVKFGTKTDIYGEHETWKSMHANPYEPWICWFFNTGIQTLSSDDAFRRDFLCGELSHNLPKIQT